MNVYQVKLQTSRDAWIVHITAGSADEAKSMAEREVSNFGNVVVGSAEVTQVRGLLLVSTGHEWKNSAYSHHRVLF